MLYLVIERYKRGPGPVCERSASQGQMLPAGPRCRLGPRRGYWRPGGSLPRGITAHVRELDRRGR